MACNITRGFSPRRRGRKIVRDGRETEKRGGEGAVMVFPTRREGEESHHIPTDVYTIGWKFLGARGDSNGYCACGIRRKGGKGGKGGKLSDAAREFGVVSFRRGTRRKFEKFDRRMCRGREYERESKKIRFYCLCVFFLKGILILKGFLI